MSENNAIENETEKIVKNYITLCEEMENTKAYGDAMDLIEEISDSLYGRVPNLNSGLYHYDGYHDDAEVSAVSHDLRVMKTKLICYLDDLKKAPCGNIPASTIINNNNYNSQQVSIDISFDQVIHYMQDLPSDKLNDDEKKEFEKLLRDVRDNTKKESAWKHVLTFIADKGMDVIVSTMPFLYQLLSKWYLSQGH